MKPTLMALLGIIILITPAPSFAGDCGDVNNSGTINALDITYLINYLYKHGPAPNCGISYAGVCGDVNRSGTVNALDITYLINYLYKHGPAPDCPYTSPITTTIIPPTDTTAIQNFDTALGTVILDESSAYAQAISVGDVIIGQDNQVAPDGFLRKIISKTTQGGSTVLETQQATMSEAFESMDISETHQLMPSGIKSYKLYNGSKFVPDKAGETFTVQLDCILYDQDGDPGTTNDQIKLDGQYAFTAALFTNIEMSWFHLNKFEAGIATHQDVDLDLIASMQWQFANEIKFDLAEFHFGAIPVGGIVWLVPTLTVEAHIQGDLTVTVETGITYTQQLRYGLGYANNAYYDISESTKDFTYTPPQFTAEFNFEPGVSLNASCLLYGIAGPYMAGKAGFHFQSVLNVSPCIVDLTFDLNAILYAVVGIQCDIIGLDYNKEYQLYTHPIGEWIYHLGGCGTVTDIDGNTYQTVKIGNQWWMAENLKVTHYRNGDAIPNVTDNAEWQALTAGAYCNYDNNPSYVATYGHLYNWYAVNDSRNIAPAGWHVPSDAEWQTLVDYLGGDAVAGGKMKEAGTVHWNSPNTGATNESGFSGLPGGLRNHVGTYTYMGYDAFFWSSTETDLDEHAWFRYLHYYASVVNRDNIIKLDGFSVRCVKDPTVTDIDGNVYQTVTIGTQVWMEENLKATHYRNGEAIPNVTDGTSWSGLTTGAYCEYNNDLNNVATYGRLYNWHSANDSRNIAPAGWHVPSADEWQTLVNYLGGDAVAGGKMKETGTSHWWSPNTGATNESGFSALPGGYRGINGYYGGMGDIAYFWSSTDGPGDGAWFTYLSYSDSEVGSDYYYVKPYGFSIRCVKD